MIAYRPTRPLSRSLRLSYRTAGIILLALFFAFLFGWTAKSLMSIQPVPVVPCRTCAEKCPCPRLTGTLRCGCPQ